MKDTPFTFRELQPDQGSLELTEDYVRQRAYQLYEQRGRLDGHDLDDWLQAEAEILGRKPATSASAAERDHEAADAAAA